MIRRPLYRLVKRSLDLLFSGLALLLLLPFLLPLVVLLRLTGEGEMFYLQTRVGYRGRKFKLIKFATMLKASPEIGTRTITIKDDPRVLPLGRLLRKAKINELPQILNVLKGDMTLVGPRPLTEDNFALYSDKVQQVILRNAPGVTGIGSVVFRDEESLLSLQQGPARDYVQREIAPYKGALELWYDQHKSFLVDSKLIILTALVILWPTSELHSRFFRDLPSREKPKQAGS